MIWTVPFHPLVFPVLTLISGFCNHCWQSWILSYEWLKVWTALDFSWLTGSNTCCSRTHCLEALSCFHCPSLLLRLSCLFSLSLDYLMKLLFNIDYFGGQLLHNFWLRQILSLLKIIITCIMLLPEPFYNFYFLFTVKELVFPLLRFEIGIGFAAFSHKSSPIVLIPTN